MAKSDPPRELADTLVVGLNRPVNRLLKSVAVGNGVLYAYSVKDHAAVLLLYLGSDGFYHTFTCTRTNDWEEEFYLLWFRLEYGEVELETAIPPSYLAQYGQQVECPEFRKMGLRIFTTGLAGRQVWSVYFWPRKWVLPKYGAYAQIEVASLDERGGMFSLMHSLYETLPISHTRHVVNWVIERLKREAANG